MHTTYHDQTGRCRTADGEDGVNPTDQPLHTDRPPVPWAWRAAGEPLPPHTVEVDGVMYPSGTQRYEPVWDESFPDL